MAVIIRLSRRGHANQPFYRITVADKARFRDGKFIEVIGTVNPRFNPPKVELKADRARHWIGHGAVPSVTVADIFKKQIPGFWEERVKHQRSRIVDARKKRKARAKGKKK